MKEVRIISVSLRNWRGQTRKVTLDGKDAVVSGRNHSGKSSVMNAFLWCVTGFDSEDRSNYLLFDDRVEQTHDNSVPAEVEVELSVDGNITRIGRTAAQGWVRRRGTDKYERTGSDNYTFFLDGVERSSGQFAQDMEYIFGASKDKLKIMLNLSYFLTLDWKAQRKQLGDIIGEVAESDFDDAARFRFIFDDMQRFTIEQIKEKYKAILRPIKESVQRLPIEIDTINSSLPSLEGVEEAKRVKAECDAEMERIDAIIADRANAAREMTDRRVQAVKEIGDMEEALERGRREYERNADNEPNLVELIRQRDEALNSNRNIASQKNMDALDCERMESRLKTLREKAEWHDRERERLKAVLSEVKQRQFEGDRCPYCKQTLPTDMLENAKEKFYEALEGEKAAIVSQGKNNNAQKDKVLAEIAEIEQKLAELKSRTYNPVNIAPYDAKIAAMRASAPKYDETAEYREKMAQIEEKRANLPVVGSTDDSELMEKRRQLRIKADNAVSEMAAEKQRESALKTVREKTEALKHAAEEMAMCEGKINLIAEYEKERAEIIRTRVNRLFRYCEVAMETTDKSGCTIPACIINDRGGVDFRVTNTASQIACKVDIASAFQRFYEVSLPLFIDNCESVNEANMPEHEGQIIGLRVSEGDFEVNVKE